MANKPARASLECRRRAGWIRLHESSARKCYSFPDPENEDLRYAMWTARNNLESLTQDQAFMIARAAAAYVVLTAEGETECALKKLREVRRAVRMLREDERTLAGDKRDGDK